jgi:hypothetical protein
MSEHPEYVDFYRNVNYKLTDRGLEYEREVPKSYIDKMALKNGFTKAVGEYKNVFIDDNIIETLNNPPYRIVIDYDDGSAKIVYNKIQVTLYDCHGDDIATLDQYPAIFDDYGYFNCSDSEIRKPSEIQGLLNDPDHCINVDFEKIVMEFVELDFSIAYRKNSGEEYKTVICGERNRLYSVIKNGVEECLFLSHYVFIDRNDYGRVIYNHEENWIEPEVDYFFINRGEEEEYLSDEDEEDL